MTAITEPRAVDGAAAELAIYCTGDWDEDVQRRHAAQVRLLRP